MKLRRGHRPFILFVPVLCLVPLFPYDVAAQPLAGATAIASGPDSSQARAWVVSGAVVDSTGAAISGATVTLTTANGARHTTTDRAGHFTFEDVSARAASLTISFERFAPITLQLTGPRRDLRIVLEPVPVREDVTVRAPALTARRITAGTRTETALRDVPQAVSLITRDLIANQSMEHGRRGPVRSGRGHGTGRRTP